MLIYEVNLEVDESINHKMAGWLPDHITEMLGFDGFKAAHWYFRNPEDETPADASSTEGSSKSAPKTLWTIHYLVESRAALDDYFKNNAPRMREEGKNRFGDQFTATRRILNLLSVAG